MATRKLGISVRVEEIDIRRVKIAVRLRSRTVICRSQTINRPTIPRKFETVCESRRFRRKSTYAAGEQS
jgi:hypothetical protein